MKIKHKKRLLIIAAVILVIAVIATVVSLWFIRNPNYKLRKGSNALKENEAVQIEYAYDGQFTKKPGTYSFEAAKSAEYVFTISDINVTEDAVITMHIMDDSLSDIIAEIDNTKERDDDGNPFDITGAAMLQQSGHYYVAFDIFPDDQEKEQFSGSFKLTVTEATGDKAIKEIKSGGRVSLKVKPEEQRCVLFKPETTGYYRFESSIISDNASVGFASITSITSSDEEKIDVTEGLCYLEQDKEYYIWTAVNEITARRSKISITCTELETAEFTGYGELELNSGTVIEYTAESSEDMAVYSVSGGDPAVLIYEMPGFPLRTDDSSGSSLSANDHDFAVVFSTASSQKYIICVYGDVNDCTVKMAKYIGDGSTLETEDVADPEEADQEEEQEDTDQEEANSEETED